MQAGAAEALAAKVEQGGPSNATAIIRQAQDELHAAKAAYEEALERHGVTPEVRREITAAVDAAKAPAPVRQEAKSTAEPATVEANETAARSTPTGPEAKAAGSVGGRAAVDTAGEAADAATVAAARGAADAAAAAAPSGTLPLTGTAAQRAGMNLSDAAARAVEITDDQVVNVHRLLQEGRPREAIDLIGINPLHVQGREGITEVLNALHDTFAPAFAKANQRVKSEEVTKALADSIASTPAQAREALARTFGATRDLDAMALLAKRYMTSSSQAVLDLSKRVAGGDRAATGELIAAVARAKEAREFFEGTASSFGRALRSLRIDSDALVHLTPQDIAEMAAEAGGREAVQKFAERVALMQHPEQIARLIKGSFADRFMHATAELFINNILSGPTTQTINLASSTMNALISPIRHILGGAFTGDWNAVRGGVSMYHALGESFVDHLRLLKLATDGRGGLDEIAQTYMGDGIKPELLNGIRAFMGDAPVLDSAGVGATTDGVLGRHAIASYNFGVTNPLAAAAIDTFGKAIRLPTRLMMSTDEIVKGMAYRMDLRRQATELALEGRRTGSIVDDKAMAEFITRTMNDPPKELHDLAIQASREATFSQKLDRNGGALDRIGARFADMTTAYPPLKFFLPFVTTPTNLLKWFADHSVVSPMLTGNFYRDIRGVNGPMAQRMAMGKMGLGATMWGAAYYLTSTGAVTGAIPNGNAGQSERASGALPYSIRVTNADGSHSFVPFSRFDPIAMHLGIAADMAQLWGRTDARTQEGFFTSYVIAAAQNLFNKSYLKGVSDMFSLVNDPFASDTNPGERLTRFLANTAASLVPFSGLQRGIARTFDPTQREVRVSGGDDDWPTVRRLLNQVMANTPGFSSSLPPVRDLLGEPVQVPVGYGSNLTGGLLGAISPLQYRDESSHPFLQELRRLGYDMAPLVPWRNSDGLPMTPQQRDRLITLTTQDVTIQGKTMQEYLDDFVQSEAYARLTDDGRDGSPGSRRQVLGNIVRGFKQLGEAALMEDDPAWREQVRAARIQRRSQLIPAILSGVTVGQTIEATHPHAIKCEGCLVGGGVRGVSRATIP
ncbi:hypothetical protein M0638_25710 [Roseomonas sp. NAR14]|uniref:Large polyvalent protein associated domain-containing protein n=1 Tax=Roseomonas acroporae TaxID=2937791 RepID=A0A9X1YCR2_9PROT|nr:hypothetical protein [Roseomonas acroporae]MCK8787758.1 hypothetical protein [Roseomonas acroporae]